LALARFYDGKDRFYLEAIGIAVGHHDQKRREIILADFDKNFPELNDKTLDLIWELRPPSVLARLNKELTNAKLTPAQRGRIVDILAGSDDAKAGLALLRILQADLPQGVRERVAANLQLFLPGKWQSLRNNEEVKRVALSLLEKPQTRDSALAIIGAAQLISLSSEVAELARDTKEPESLRLKAAQTLGLLPSEASVTQLMVLTKFKPISLRSEAIRSLGQLAEQDSKQPSARAALSALRIIVEDEEEATEQRVEAVTALAGSRAGTIWLLQAHERKQLPDALKADSGRLLRSSPHQDLRDRAMLAFPPPARLDPKKLPTIASLMSRPGDPAHGKQIMAESQKNDLQCLKCHTIQGVGGNVGPDLSAIGKKASRENLFESILFPSKAIADQYLSWIIETQNGVRFTGLIVEETPDHITLRDANAKDTKIAKHDIASREKSPVSIMPADLLAYMTEDDLVDMVAYLLTLKAEENSDQKRHE